MYSRRLITEIIETVGFLPFLADADASNALFLVRYLRDGSKPKEYKPLLDHSFFALGGGR
jgi:hypothetical protein